MQEKLGNFFEGGGMIITQSPHGSLQGGLAMDFVSYDSFKILAPIDGIVERKYGSGWSGGFHFVFGSYDILFHHCTPIRPGFFHKGETIGNWLHKAGSLHIHTAIKVRGKWELVLSYIDRRVNLLPEKGNPPTKWTNWNTYPDKYITLGNNDMVQVKFGTDDVLAEKLEITATTLNVRQHPNTSSPIVATLNKGDITTPSTFATGEAVDGNSAWAKHKSGGWYSCRWTKRAGTVDCSEVEKELKKKEAEIALKQTKINEMTEDLTKIKVISGKY